MRNLELNLGKPCNNRCVFCATGSESRGQRGWMSVADAREALATGREQGAESVGLIGGEPTLYAELTEVVAAAREAGYRRIAICTNGRRLAEPARLEALLAAGLTRVALSIHSHRAALEDRITRRLGAFDEKIAALGLLVEARDAGRLPHGLALNTVLHAHNVMELEALAARFAELGVADLRLNFIRPEVEPEQAREWVPTFRRTTPRVRRLLERNETRLGLELTLADFPLCRLPWELLANPRLRERYVGEARDLRTEVAMFRPAASGGTKRFDWQAQRAGQLKEHYPVCERCPLRDRCEGVWRGYADIHAASELDDGPTIARAWVDA